MLPYEVFEEYAKKRVRELIEKGETLTIVGSFIDFMGDGKIVQCSRCGVPVFIRPWLLEATIKYKWKIVCMFCINPQDLKGQAVMDCAKIETMLDEDKR